MTWTWVNYGKPCGANATNRTFKNGHWTIHPEMGDHYVEMRNATRISNATEPLIRKEGNCCFSWWCSNIKWVLQHYFKVVHLQKDSRRSLWAKPGSMTSASESRQTSFPQRPLASSPQPQTSALVSPHPQQSRQRPQHLHPRFPQNLRHPQTPLRYPLPRSFHCRPP